jgi:hypothetical protein
MRPKLLSTGMLLVLLAASLSGCASPYSPYTYDRVATTSFGLGAFGTAMGYAITGDAMGAALGGLSGMAGGAIIGSAIEANEAARAAGAPPPSPPPPPRAYERPRGYYEEEYYEEERVPRRYRERTIVERDGRVVREYDTEVEIYDPY